MSERMSPRELPVKTHSGQPIDQNDDFFAVPPAEIGPLISARTTLKRDKRPLPPAIRLLCLVLGGGFGIGLGVVIANQALWRVTDLGRSLAVFFFGAIGLALVFLATRFRHTCTFVGKLGIARVRCRGSRENVIEEVFLFQSASELRTKWTHGYNRGFYAGTVFNYVWTDHGGQKSFVIRGEHHQHYKTPKPTHGFWFGHAAEVAWTNHLIRNIRSLANEKGEVRFRLKGNDAVELGPEGIAFYLGGEYVRLEAADIARVEVRETKVAILRTDASEGWFSSRGVYKLPYKKLANARLFLALVEYLLGIRIVGEYKGGGW